MNYERSLVEYYRKCLKSDYYEKFYKKMAHRSRIEPDKDVKEKKLMKFWFETSFYFPSDIREALHTCSRFYGYGRYNHTFRKLTSKKFCKLASLALDFLKQGKFPEIGIDKKLFFVLVIYESAIVPYYLENKGIYGKLYAVLWRKALELVPDIKNCNLPYEKEILQYISDIIIRCFIAIGPENLEQAARLLAERVDEISKNQPLFELLPDSPLITPLLVCFLIPVEQRSDACAILTDKQCITEHLVIDVLKKNLYYPNGPAELLDILEGNGTINRE